MESHDTILVELVEAPQLYEEDDRVVVGARAKTVPFGAPVQVTLLPAGPGVYWPHKVGDLLVCVVVLGRVLGGVHPVAWKGDVVPPQSLANLELRAPRGGNLVLAPDRDTPGSEVRLGRETRDGAAYEALMTYPQASADILALRDGLVSALAKIGALQNAAAPGSGAGTISDAAEIATTVLGGTPSDGVKAAR